MAICVGIVGATGLVGLEMKKSLAELLSGEKIDLKLFASTARPEQNILALQDSAAELRACQFILGAATAEIAEEVRAALGPDQVFIDNSSAFRLDPEIPLIVPEVNGALLESRPQVVANPNCTAILLCMALNPLKPLGLQRIVVSTYQAASGAGLKGLEELERQGQAWGRGESMPAPQVFPYVLVGNVLSHNSSVRPEGNIGAGYNDEEWKVIEESRKILGVRHLTISASCIRVPVYRAHTEAVTVDLQEEKSLEELRELFAKAPGLKIVDDWKANHFPMPLEAQNQDLVLVGRIRKDPALPRTLHFMLSGDQIRKGAATNAVQILRQILTRHR